MNPIKHRLMETPAEASPPSTPAPAAPTPFLEEVDYGQLTSDIEAHDAEEFNETSPAPESAEPAKSTEGAAAPVPAVPAEPTAQPQASLTPLKVEPQAPTEPTPAVVAPSTEPEKTASPPAPAEAPAKPAEPVDFEKHRAEFIPKLEALYKLSDDDAEELRVSPHEAMPKLAARLHYEVQLATFNAVMNTLPQVVEMAFKQRQAQQESEKQFYDRWPALKESKYADTVLNSIRAYTAANPKAPYQDVVEKAGLVAMISLGLNPMPQGSAPPAQETPTIPPKPMGAGASPSGPLPVTRPTGVDDDIAALVEFELRENR